MKQFLASKESFKMILILFFNILMIVTISFAWLVITKNVKVTDFVVSPPGQDADHSFEFYYFKSKSYRGNPKTNPTLLDSLAQNTTEYEKYHLLPQTGTDLLNLTAEKHVWPGDKYSFALRVKSRISENHKVEASFAKIQSLNIAVGHEGVNDIQRAFQHTTVKIGYINANVEGPTVIGSSGVSTYNKHFGVSSVSSTFMSFPLNKIGSSDSDGVIFFDIYFDPLIYGIDPITSLELPDHGNIFSQQKFVIGSLIVARIDV